MKQSLTEQIAVIASDDPITFEEQVNEKMALLSNDEPSLSIDISNGFRAVIRYTVTETAVESIADEFHLEGIRHICRECPLHHMEKDKRIKYVTCDYADLGQTHLDHECCEYFYKQLKLGRVVPGEPNKSGKVNKGGMSRW